MNFRRINEAYPISGLRNELDRLFTNFLGELPDMGNWGFGETVVFPP